MSDNLLPPGAITEDPVDIAADELAEAQGAGRLPRECRRLPWESAGEYDKFFHYLLCPGRRSVRGAYKAYCKAKGIKPNKDPGSDWFQVYKGHYRAFRQADKQAAAIERAGEVHGRFPDWERIEAMARSTGRIGQHGDDEMGQVMDELTLIELAFWSLAIDGNGDPIPDLPTWVERTAAYWELEQNKTTEVDNENG